MNFTTSHILTGALGTTLLTGLWLSNPSMNEYRQHILVPQASGTVLEWAAADRRAIEHEASKALSAYRANRPTQPDMTTLTLLRTVPSVPSYLPDSGRHKSRGALEHVTVWKHEALKRVTDAKANATQGLLAELTLHTTRHSYLLGSVFETCSHGKPVRYLAVANQFVSIDPASCPTGAPR
jgi:hypothetical protein